MKSLGYIVISTESGEPIRWRSRGISRTTGIYKTRKVALSRARTWACFRGFDLPSDIGTVEIFCDL